ncbi:hypothetical protein FH039_06850 [Thermococcus indicus]|uniref:Flavodoxin-like domain-containing protein n=1 Tax=Thermococcus indicus TaxID=2586643 RepID=A0A4Y5SKQ2_9EURY|nr:flavodoxin domain-containing protein [Thermococcus indicus]QDA31375.1 hypothetical protein FH039_06850 [Thermococcus indicus]
MELKALVVYATRYGSSKRAAEIVGKTLGEGTEIVNVEKFPSPESYDLVVFVAPIYGDGPLKPMMEYIERYKEKLEEVPKAFLLLALDTSGVVFRGELHGGILYSKPLVEAFEVPPFTASSLGASSTRTSSMTTTEKFSKGFTQ